jgi:hypothetical protein
MPLSAELPRRQYSLTGAVWLNSTVLARNEGAGTCLPLSWN